MLTNAWMTAAPLPKFDGGSRPGSVSAQPQSPTQLQQQSTGGPIRVPPLTPEKALEFGALFEKSGAQNGVLAGMY